jgi:pimeloyl-ACP methyl ester carboxylesterase
MFDPAFASKTPITGASSTERFDSRGPLARARRAIVALAVAAAILGCDDDDSGDGNPLTTPTPIASTSPTATPTSTPLPELACADLIGESIGNADIGDAMITGDPEYCRVSARIPPKLNFEVRLPTQWNGKALFVGGAVFNGVILTPEQSISFNPGLSESGYAIIATDSGHQSATFLDAAWALDDPEALENYGFLATHSVLESARLIIEERYGTPPSRSYMIGQSEGGRSGLVAAQRFPDDFDGIVSLEPATNIVAMGMSFNRTMKQIFGAPGGHLSAVEIATVANAIRDACDSLDGITDGIVSNVAACDFDASELRCREGQQEDCLTDEQVASVRALHSDFELDFELARASRVGYGYAVGGEDSPGSWGTWIFGQSPAQPGLLFTVQDQVLKYMVTKDLTLDSLQFDPNDYRDELIALSEILDATDPDLSEFASEGGKLILWHGLSDYALSPYNTIRYYEEVVETAGGEAQASEFIRFYTSPGVNHTNSGSGPGITDFLAALEAWVEEGTSPGDLVSVKLDQAGNPVLSRPLCRYPSYPHYDGSGDPAAASSFVCTAP